MIHHSDVVVHLADQNCRAAEVRGRDTSVVLNQDAVKDAESTQPISPDIEPDEPGYGFGV